MIFHPGIADHVLFALLAFILPLFAVWYVKPQAGSIPSHTPDKIRLYWLNSMVLWFGALIVIIIWWISGRGFGILGFRLPITQPYPEWLPLVMLFVLLYMFDAFVSWNEAEESPAEALLPKNRLELFHFSTVVSLSAGICEEIVFRGFLITYLLSLTEGFPYDTFVAVAGSAFIFGVVHAYQGWGALFKIVLLSVLFALIFVLSESLLLVILLHYLVDFIGGLLAYYRENGRITTEA